MELLGIDFGTSRLRIATANNDTVGVSPHKYSSARLPFVIQSAAPFRITALKRILDFDSALPMPPSGISSMALLADIFRDVLGECCPTGLSDRYTVVAVPPCISQRQRSALRIVMTDLGLTRVRLVDDTLAALLATWELVRTYKTILVYSWGAGMFTAGMYRMKANSYHLVSQEGDRELGGDDFDAVLVDVIVAQLKKLGRDGAPNNADDLIHIVNVAERLKRLSPLENTMTVPLNRLLPGTSNGVADVTISTENLSAAIQRSTESTIALALKAIGDASESKPEAILAVGGMTCSPMVQEALRRHFGIPVIQASEHSVAIGTVLFGQLLPQSEWGTQRQAAGSQRNADLTAQTAAAPDSAAQTTVQAESRNGQEKWSDNFVPMIDSAQGEYDNNRVDRAIAAFDEVIDRLNRFKGDLYCKAASALSAEGRTSEALALLKRGNQRDPRNRFIAVDFAQTCYREALQARSGHKPQITIELASEGASSLRSLLPSEPNNATLLAALLYLQGIGFWDQGKLRQASLLLTESVTIDPKNEAYVKNLETVRNMLRKLGPNDVCPCRSGLKYKKCCGGTR